MWSSNGTKYDVHGTGGDSLPHFCCPTAADTDFVNNTTTAAATAAAKSAGPSAAAHHSATTSSVTADPAPPAVPTGNQCRAVYIFFQVLALSALGYPGVLYLKIKHLK